MLTEEQKRNLIVTRNFVRKQINLIQIACTLAASITDEVEMTTDCMWGNCTLEQLEAHLESVKAEA